MKALLMHRDRDFALRQELPCNESALTQDLELDTLAGAMAGDDRFLFDVARQALFSGLRNDVGTILYRQEIVRDCLDNRAAVREFYDLATEALERKRNEWLGVFSLSPAGVLSDAIKLLRMFMGMLRRLRDIARRQAGRFKSEGFTTLWAMIERELSDEYFARVHGHLTELKFYKGILLSAELDERNDGANYVLHAAWKKRPNWLKRLLGKGPPGYAFRLHERDEVGGRILSEMQARGIDGVANALAQSADHVRSFFEMLRVELAFYVGCLNPYERLASKREPICFPRPLPAGQRRRRFRGLYDPCLSLLMERPVVGNTMEVAGKSLVIITGANQGGKSVFLRSVGLAQMMMQSGMYVAAESFEGELCEGLFTHYKREEDATMKWGKLDEELARMSDMADHLAPNSLVLFNESFAATNEREGSEIARQIVGALLERGVAVYFVTHHYDLAHSLFDRKSEQAVFLRAERLDDGTRTFRLVEGEPLETSYGEDLYREIFPVETDN